jgi:hypothetical protein
MHASKSLHTAILGALLLALCTPLAAQIRVLEQSYEVAPAWIVLPGSPGSSLALRKCPNCAPTNVATNAATVYQVGEENLSLSEFAAFLRQNPGVQVTVMTSMRGDLITRVRVAAAAPTPASAR